MEVEKSLTLDVFLHFGTLLAVVVVYWDDIVDIITFKPQYRRFTLYIIIGTIPAGVLGILFEDFFVRLFSSALAVGFMLIITGSLLWISDKIEAAAREMEEMKLSDSLLVGFAQAFAIIPGISRSGSTIVAGLFKGLNRELAAKFSFLLSIPAIGGATLLKVKDLIEVGASPSGLVRLAVGTATSAVVGYLAIKLLLKLIDQERLRVFAYYCWGLGLISILFFLG
jgi:undecaprenyl-diphosphatase